jgi:cyclophilin family peptidyl-prolyl cis-trans isomerase
MGRRRGHFHGRGRRRVALEPLESRRLLAISVGMPLPDLAVAPGAAPQVVSTADLFTVSGVDVQGTVVRMATQGGVNASYRDLFIELFDSALPGRSAAPVSTANFLTYVNAGSYGDTFFHRATDFAGDLGPARFLQGGGFSVVESPTGPRVGTVTTGAPINLEWAADRPNAAGTIAYARTSDPNSATSGFFFNVAANSSFDQVGNRYTVFGHVRADGQAILDEYAALGRVNAGGQFGTLPVVDNGAASIFDRLVVVRSASVVAAPQAAVGLRVASSAPAVVSARMGTGGGIQLGYGTAVGSAVITVTGTDLSGAVATASFTVTVAEPAPPPTPDPIPTPDPTPQPDPGPEPEPVVTRDIVLGGSGPTSLVATDADGTLSTFTWSGPGTATFRFVTGAEPVVVRRQATLPTAAPLVSIVIDAGTVKSSLVATGRGGDGVVEIDRLESDGAVGKLSLPGVRVRAAVQLDGGVASIVVNGVSGTVDVGGKRVVTANLGSVSDATVSLPAVNAVVLAAVRDATIDLTSTGTVTAAAVERSTFAVAGRPRRLAFASLVDAEVLASGAVGSVVVNGGVTGSRIEAGSRIDLVQAATFVDSTLAVGVAAGVGFPTRAAEVSPTSRLGALVIKARTADAFAGGRVAAGTIGSASLGLLSGGAGLGSEVFARSVTTLSGRGPARPFSLRRVERMADVGAVLAAAGLGPERLSIAAGG